MRTDDRASVDRMRSKKRDAEIRRVAGLQKMMLDSNGRAFISWLLRECGLYETSFRMGDPTWMSFHEGQRNIGLRLLAEIHRHCRDSYPVMLSESLFEELTQRPRDEEKDDAGREESPDA